MYANLSARIDSQRVSKKIKLPVVLLRSNVVSFSIVYRTIKQLFSIELSSRNNVLVELQLVVLGITTTLTIHRYVKGNK